MPQWTVNCRRVHCNCLLTLRVASAQQIQLPFRAPCHHSNKRQDCLHPRVPSCEPDTNTLLSNRGNCLRVSDVAVQRLYTYFCLSRIEGLLGIKRLPKCQLLHYCTITTPSAYLTLFYKTWRFHGGHSMKNAVFWDIRTQFVPNRRHITSPLQSPAG
jgi:hypothetical protein